jgi:hypothetical protein
VAAVDAQLGDQQSQQRLSLLAHQAAVERGHAVGESFGAEAAGLERLLVAVQRALGLLELPGERGAPLDQGGPVVVGLGGGMLDRLADEGAVTMEAGDLRKDGGLELVAVDP